MRGTQARALARPSRRRALSVLVVLALTAGGCTSPKTAPTGSGPSASAGTGGTAGGSGNLPGAPNAGAGPDAATLPPAAPDPGGSPQSAATALAKQVAQGGTAAEAALRTALVKGGITLTEPDGTVDAKGADPSIGVSIPIGQIFSVADQNTYDHGLLVSDMAGALDAIWSDKINQGKLRAAILQDIRDQESGSSPATPKTQQFLAAFIVAVGQQANPVADIDQAADNDVELTGLQAWLIWLSLAGGAYFQAVAAARAHSSGYRPPSPHAITVADNPCSGSNGTIGDAAANVASGVAGGVPFTPWEGVSGLLPEGSPGNVMGLGEWLGVGNAILSLVHLLVEGMSLTATDSGLTPTPLVRTKGIAPAFGDKGVLRLTLEYKLPVGQYANCLRATLNSSGLDFSLPNDGPVKDAQVTWEIENDAGGIDNNPAAFYPLGGDSIGGTVTYTDDSGSTRTGLGGRPQKSPVPNGVQPFNRTVTILAGIALKSRDALSTLNDALSAALGGIAAPIIIAVNMAERARVFDVTLHVIIKDWPRDFKVDADVQQDNGGGNFPHLSGIKCDGVAGEWDLGINGSTKGVSFTLDANGHGTASGDFGPVDVQLQEGDPAKLIFSIPGGYRQTVTVIPGQWCDHPF